MHSGNSDPFVIIIFIVVVIIGAIASAIAARKRREGMSALAQRLSLDFDDGQDYDLPARYEFLKQFSEGDNRYATNVISGNYQQRSVFAFDYHYETYSYDKNGRHTHHYWFSFLILEMPGTLFPDLTIRREGFFTKVAEMFGYSDIKFESAEFSKTFCVRSPDKKFAYDVCHAQMMEYLLANRDLSIEIENEIIALAFDSRLAVEQFERDLQRLAEIRSRLPDYLFTPTQ